MVFGVAAFSLIGQGLTMSRLLDTVDIATRSEAERLYELLMARARAVDRALDRLEELYGDGRVPAVVHDEFREAYETEKEDLSRAIARLLEEHPDIREEERRMGEHRVLKEEKSAVMDAIRSGEVDDAVGEQLLEEIDLRLDRVRAGERTVHGGRVQEPFWRRRVREYGLDLEPEEDED